MQIRKDGFVYRIAYEFNDNPPKYQISICRLFWSFFGGLFSWSCFSVIVVIVSLVKFLSGKRPYTIDGDIYFRKMESLPKFGKRDIWPIWWVMAFLLVILIVFAIQYFAKTNFAQIALTSGIIFYWVFHIIELIALGIVIIFAFFVIIREIYHDILQRMFGNSSGSEDMEEIKMLFKKWRQAKKEKVCPIIKIV